MMNLLLLDWRNGKLKLFVNALAVGRRSKNKADMASSNVWFLIVPFYLSDLSLPLLRPLEEIGLAVRL